MAAAVSALAAVSCQKDDTLAYNNMTMGNIVNGRIVSDQGNTFNVVNQLSIGSFPETNRIMILCDVLNETKGASNEYDIYLRDYANVLDKKAVALEDAQEGEITVQDPVLIDELWFSGEYILNFRHNSYGESLSSDNASGLTLSRGAYVSFPIADIIQEDNAKLILSWQWYKKSGLDFDFNTEEEYRFEYDWQRKGFIQNF